MVMQEQVVSVYAGTRGYLDNVPTVDVRRFEGELIEWFRSRHSTLLDGIASSGDIKDEAAFENAIKSFAAQFRVSGEALGEAPDPQAQGEAHKRIVDSATTLPEEEINRED